MIGHQIDMYKEKYAMKIAWLLPHWLVKMVIVRVFAHASTGMFQDVEAGRITIFNAMDAWEKDR